jgi:cell division inhibitor SepF
MTIKIRRFMMSGAIMNKIWGAFGMDANEEEEEYEDENQEVEVEEEDNKKNKLWDRKSSKVVTLPQQQQIRMVISQPTTFDQAEDICDLLKDKQSVIVNLEYVNKDIARRIIDVVSGAVHALDGHIQKVSNSIFLIAPYNYEITNEMAREEIKNKLSVSWLKNTGNN